MTKHNDEARELLDLILKLVRSRSPDCFEQEATEAISTVLAARDAEIERLTERCTIYEGHNKTYQDHIKVSSAVIDELRAQIERMREGLAAVRDLIADSDGVYGLHRNGDPAPWDELRTGGIYDSWLIKFDDALLSNETDIAATAKEPRS